MIFGSSGNECCCTRFDVEETIRKSADSSEFCLDISLSSMPFDGSFRSFLKIDIGNVIFTPPETYCIDSRIRKERSQINLSATLRAVSYLKLGRLLVLPPDSC